MWLGFLAFAHAVCGDGVVDADEQCDDFNLVAGDGCSQGCEAEPFWECASPAEPFVESFRWSAQSNCAAAPVADLAGIGVRVDLPVDSLRRFANGLGLCVRVVNRGCRSLVLEHHLAVRRLRRR
jgi:cysteine-rich repeat protein